MEHENGVWTVSDSARQKYSIDKMSFESFFKGDVPHFEVSYGRANNSISGSKKQAPPKEPKTSEVSKKKSIEETPKSEKKKKESAEVVDEDPAKLRMAKAQKLHKKLVVDMSDEEFDLWREFVLSEEKMRELDDIEAEMEKIVRREEKEKEKERLREEKLKQKEYLKELKRPKEDLECEQLAELARPAPVSSKIPDELFGDALMIVEFLSCFGQLFELGNDFPNGFSMDDLDEALY